MNPERLNSHLIHASTYSADLHIHTAYCGHASGTLVDMVESAIHLGLREIGFTGHFPYPEGFVEPVPKCVISKKNFPQFISEVAGLREKYKEKIIIRLAAEVDYIPQYVTETKKMVQAYAFDYIMGSVHVIENIQIDYSEDMLSEHLGRLGGVNRLWEKYWQYVEELISSGICDMIAHFDLPKKYGISRPLRYDSERIDYLLDLIKDRNCVLEINTGGIDRSYNREPYPSLNIIRMASEKKVDITLGSDAHHPQEIGRHFESTRKMLRSLGWKHVVVFQDREKVYQPL